MKLSDFSFELPEELIAKFPASPRDHSKLLVVERTTQKLEHRSFFELPEILKTNDLLVVNNTKVIPARLFGEDTVGKTFEIFLLKSLDPLNKVWQCLVKPGKKVKTGITIFFPNGGRGYVTPQDNGVFEITFHLEKDRDALEWLYDFGNSPLPPYLKRKAEAKDKVTYQTVYAKASGSVAAPTAGLHFTDELLKKLELKGIAKGEVTLHVGYGTFSPVRTPNILDHQMHGEEYQISQQTLNQIQLTKSGGGRVIAVGTTSLRTLESYPSLGIAGSTQLYITPGYQFKIVDSLITNFHLPESSLYILVASLLGIDFCREVYQEAISQKYRFYSYGDAMIIL